MLTNEKALYQVKLILDCLPKEEYETIPKDIVNYIENNWKYDESVTIDPNLPLESQNIDKKTYDFLETILKRMDMNKNGYSTMAGFGIASCNTASTTTCGTGSTSTGTTTTTGSTGSASTGTTMTTGNTGNTSTGGVTYGAGSTLEGTTTTITDGTGSSSSTSTTTGTTNSSYTNQSAFTNIAAAYANTTPSATTNSFTTTSGTTSPVAFSFADTDVGTTTATGADSVWGIPYTSESMVTNLNTSCGSLFASNAATTDTTAGAGSSYTGTTTSSSVASGVGGTYASSGTTTGTGTAEDVLFTESSFEHMKLENESMSSEIARLKRIIDSNQEELSKVTATDGLLTNFQKIITEKEEVIAKLADDNRQLVDCINEVPTWVRKVFMKDVNHMLGKGRRQ